MCQKLLTISPAATSSTTVSATSSATSALHANAPRAATTRTRRVFQRVGDIVRPQRDGGDRCEHDGRRRARTEREQQDAHVDGCLGQSWHGERACTSAAVRPHAISKPAAQPTIPSIRLSTKNCRSTRPRARRRAPCGSRSTLARPSAMSSRARLYHADDQQNECDGRLQDQERAPRVDNELVGVGHDAETLMASAAAVRGGFRARACAFDRHAGLQAAHDRLSILDARARRRADHVRAIDVDGCGAGTGAGRDEGGRRHIAEAGKFAGNTPVMIVCLPLIRTGCPITDALPWNQRSKKACGRTTPSWPAGGGPPSANVAPVRSQNPSVTAATRLHHVVANIDGFGAGHVSRQAIEHRGPIAPCPKSGDMTTSSLPRSLAGATQTRRSGCGYASGRTSTALTTLKTAVSIRSRAPASSPRQQRTSAPERTGAARIACPERTDRSGAARVRIADPVGHADHVRIADPGRIDASREWRSRQDGLPHHPESRPR